MLRLLAAIRLKQLLLTRPLSRLSIRAAAKHLLHKNNASNKKSKMTTKLNGMA